MLVAHMGDLTIEKKVPVLGVPVTPGGLGDIDSFLQRYFSTDDPVTVSFVNPLAVKLIREHSQYRDDLEQLSVVTCDGIGMVKAAIKTGLRDQPRQAFDNTSIAPSVLSWALQNNTPLGLVGGVEGVSSEAAKRMQSAHPGLVIEGVFSGYDEQPDLAIDYFVEHQTPLVICGMGAPRQERFLLRLVDRGWKGIGFTCGGFMDQLLKGEDYFPEWIDRMDIRFLYRLLKEPRRLWRRYLVDYQVFMGQYIQLLRGGSPGVDHTGNYD